MLFINISGLLATRSMVRLHYLATVFHKVAWSHMTCSDQWNMSRYEVGLSGLEHLLASGISSRTLFSTTDSISRSTEKWSRAPSEPLVNMHQKQDINLCFKDTHIWGLLLQQNWVCADWDVFYCFNYCICNTIHGQVNQPLLLLSHPPKCSE